MSGHVFHPGHQELHGITVVVETPQAQLFVGRFDRQDESGVHMIGVSVFEPASGGQTKAEFLARTTKFGVKVDRPHLTLSADQVRKITPLSSFSSS